jgi:hypothetical protein
LIVVCVVLMAAGATVVSAQAESADAREDARFAEVSDLRSRGEFDAAIEVLTGIIDDASQSGPVLRRAYNQLVWTILARSDDVNERAHIAGDPAEAERLRGELDGMARELGNVVGRALTLFPDLRAGDDVPDPARVNQAYEPARQRMFGNLEVDSSPDSAAVWINRPGEGWTREGSTPLRRQLFPIGSYEIRLTHDGYKNTEVTSRVGPNETTRHDVTMPPSRGTGWWLTRVGVPVAGAIGVLVYALASGDDGGTPEPTPLASPPDPPSQ